MFLRLIAFCCLLFPLGAWSAEPLRIGFGTHKPPYIIEPEERGLEVDIVLAAARAGGLAAVPFFAPLERLHLMLERKTLDAIATTSPATGITACYSQPYIEYHNVAVSLASRHLRIEKIGDLGRYSVSSYQRARQLLGAEFAAAVAKNPEYREEALQITRNRLLLAGRVDVVVGDRSIIEYFMQEVGAQFDVAQPLRWHKLFPPTPYSVGFLDAEACRRFDRGLSMLRSSGEYKRIEERYLPPPRKATTQRPPPVGKRDGE